MTALSYSAREAVLGSLPVNKLSGAWIGGSLGRREMMPNSDVDLFIIETGATQGSQPGNGVVDSLMDLARGYGKFELGFLTTSCARRILRESLVDANRLIDGYGSPGSSTTAIERSILGYSTSDRQLLNIITEYNYWRCFDFPSKKGKAGPNVKYSRGGSRVSIFFNWRHRLSSGDFPLFGGERPELYTALAQSGASCDLVEALDTVILVKDVATGFYHNGRSGARFASLRTLSEVYRHLGPRLVERGVADARDLWELYSWSQARVGNAVDSLYQELLLANIPGSIIGDLADASVQDLLELYMALQSDATTSRHRSLEALVAWTIVRAGGNEPCLQVVASAALSRSLGSVWGVILAVICSPNVSDSLLRQILFWLDANETGAYLTKVVSRSKCASGATRTWARSSYVARERIQELSGEAAGHPRLSFGHLDP